MKIQLISILILISLTKVFSQIDYREGFIIDQKEDTLKGMLEYRKNSEMYKSCLFKNNNEVIIEYSSNQILGYGYINDMFLSTQIIEDTFVEVLVYGELSLFKHLNHYILKKEGVLFEIK